MRISLNRKAATVMIKIFHLSDIHLDSPFSLCSAGEAEHIIKNCAAMSPSGTLQRSLSYNICNFRVSVRHRVFNGGGAPVPGVIIRKCFFGNGAAPDDVCDVFREKHRLTLVCVRKGQTFERGTA